MNKLYSFIKYQKFWGDELRISLYFTRKIKINKKIQVGRPPTLGCLWHPSLNVRFIQCFSFYTCILRILRKLYYIVDCCKFRTYLFNCITALYCIKICDIIF